ncbi:hypothetical protein ACH4VX_28630 [Streptomyces sp. NPDC020731]|uniref:hypothetical protein n=1 Tax=Streptomyces sp. NPDC020731 TaxID=3365085 RepID=UPI0037A8795F
MNETQSPAPLPPVPDGAPAATPVKRPVRWGRVASVVGSVLLAGAVVTGVGYTVVTVDGADRDAAAPEWKFPEAAAAEDKAPKAQGLAAMLVPYGYDHWFPGPDFGEFGSDAQLSGARATALQKESLRDLPRSQRKRLEKEIDSWRVEGMAMRSYTSGSNSVYNEDEVHTVGIVLARMENKAAVRDFARFQTEFLDALDIFRKGPEIKGHKDAQCFLPPADAETDLDMMQCSARVGNVLVTLTADGAKPLDTRSVAALFREQLDRIDEPGKAV